MCKYDFLRGLIFLTRDVGQDRCHVWPYPWQSCRENLGEQVYITPLCIAARGAQYCELRKALAASSVHPPLVAGIYGRKNTGARSVVLAAGGFDDEDHGDHLCVITFRMYTHRTDFSILVYTLEVVEEIPG